MDARRNSGLRRAFRPSAESLESLKLLSTLGAGAPTSAQVSLPATPTESVPVQLTGGDGHPGGVAVVPRGFPASTVVKAGTFLVTNTENQGTPRTGSTISAIQPSTPRAVATSGVFFQGQGVLGQGESNAIGILPKGLTITGNFPRTSTTTDQLGQSMLTILDPNGNTVDQIQAPGGPLALAVHSQGKYAQVFVSNALTGSITRIDLKVAGSKLRVINEFTIASGYAHATSSPTSTEGPSGLAYNPAKDVLYVASPGDNMVYEVTQASRTRTNRGVGQSLITDTSHLHGPAGVAVAPNGTLLVTNNDTASPNPAEPSELQQYAADGSFLGEQSISTSLGAANGVAVRATSGRGLTVAVANDATNHLDLFQGTD